MTYRSPLEGREAEIIFLAPEGLAVNAGDLVARLDPTPVLVELERATQTLWQARLEQRVVEGQLEDASAAMDALSEGGETLEAEEATAAQQLAERRLERARREVKELEPLLDGGFITRDELERATLDLEQQEASTRLAKRRLDQLKSVTQPRGRQRAALQAEQHVARREHAAQRVRELEATVAALREAADQCSLYAEAPGLVVHEEHLSANPRRKVRVGDRVTPSQGMATIPDVQRMVVETSVREIDVHRIAKGLPATVRLDAFPDQRLEGVVEAVGAIARGALDRPFEDKRFDVRIDVAPTTLALRPEMTARVEIRIAQRDDVVLAPVNAIEERGAARVVAVVSGRSVTTREVRLGLSDGVHVEVLSGLEAGERVRLSARP